MAAEVAALVPVEMATAGFNEDVEQFYLSLKDLKSNSKPMIAMLTQLTEDYKEYDRELVRTIEDVIYEVAADRKLPYLYLIDSICKHVGLEYITLFARRLVPLFSHVYAACNAEVKRALVRLRKTWCKLFPDYLLNELDAKMRALDESWPYGHRMRTRSSSGSKSVLDACLRSSLEQQRSENEQQSVQPLFRTNQHLLQAKSSHSNKRAKRSTRSAATVNECPAAQTSHSQVNGIQVDASQMCVSQMGATQMCTTQTFTTHMVPTQMCTSQVAPTQMCTSQASDFQVNGDFPLNQQAIVQQPALDAFSSHPNQLSNQLPNQLSNQLSLVPAPVNHLVNANQLLAQFPATPSNPLGLGLPVTIQPAIQPPFLNRSPGNQPFISNQLIPYPSSGHPAPVLNPNLSFNVNKPKINQSLCRPILESTSTRNSSCLIPCQPKRQYSAVNPNQLSPSCVKFRRRENDNKESADQFNRKRPFDSSAASPSGKRKRNAGWGNQGNSQSNSSRNNGNSRQQQANGRSGGQQATNRLNPAMVKPNTGENSSVKINKVTTVEESIIMFESKHYKIYHLDETTSIMLMRCPIHLTFNELKYLRPEDIDPRKVFFEGRPVNVHIDERETILLAFGMQWKKFRSANGFEQYIKFGTPDREIYLNDQIIKARFGGQSVACQLNGDEELHSIRLGAPQPSVQVSEDTRVDLWYKFIKKVRTMESSNAIANSRPLKFTKKADCRSPDSTRADKDDDPKSCRDRKKNDDPDEIPLELEPESLRVKRDYLIKRMYSGLQCTSCSLRFDVQSKENKEKYSSHLDWHFRKNRKARNKIANNAYQLKRQWYYPLDQWLQFKEITLETNESKTDKPPQQAAAARTGEQQPDAEKEVPNEPARIRANPNDSLNVCATCYEKFEEIWCDEEECWLLENATLIDGHYFHPTCLITEPAKVTTSEADDETAGLDLNNNEINGKDLPEAPDTSNASEQQAETNELNHEPVSTSEQRAEVSEQVTVDGQVTVGEQTTVGEQIKVSEQNNPVVDLNNNEISGKDRHVTSIIVSINVSDLLNQSAGSDSSAANDPISSGDKEGDHQADKLSGSPVRCANEEDQQSDVPNEQENSSPVCNEEDRLTDKSSEKQSSPVHSPNKEDRQPEIPNEQENSSPVCNPNEEDKKSDEPNEKSSNGQASSPNKEHPKSEAPNEHESSSPTCSPNKEGQQSDASIDQQSSSLVRQSDKEDRPTDAPNELESNSPACSPNEEARQSNAPSEEGRQSDAVSEQQSSIREDSRTPENDERLPAESNSETPAASTGETSAATSEKSSTETEPSGESKSEPQAEPSGESRTESNGQITTESNDRTSTESSKEAPTESSKEAPIESSEETRSEPKDKTRTESEVSGNSSDEPPARPSSPVVHVKRDRYSSNESALCSIM